MKMMLDNNEIALYKNLLSILYDLNFNTEFLLKVSHDIGMYTRIPEHVQKYHMHWLLHIKELK